MKYEVNVAAIRYYEAQIEANCEDEAYKIAKSMYNNAEMEDYEDELMSISINPVEEEDGE